MSHSTHRSCPSPQTTFMPKRIIELRDHNGGNCLRLKDTGGLKPSPYVSLSYCWGGNQTTKSTLAEILLWQNALPYDQLSKTLRDAIDICRLLNVRFLWIDAICIIQDDDFDKAQQIACMPQIYRNSYFTIAAASATTAADGFLSPRTTPNCNTPSFMLPYYNKGEPLGSVTLFQDEHQTNAIDTRAWTLQERLLSPRTLEFSSSQVRWICRESSQYNQPGWVDGGYSQPFIHSGRQDILRKAVFDRVFQVAQSVNDESSARSNKERTDKEAKKDWYHLVKTYTYRNITNPADRILAISGLAQEYSRALQDDYIAGMWRRTLLQELTWEVQEPLEKSPEIFQGPSWSWTSVNGVIDFKHQYGSVRHKEQYTAQIIDCNISFVEATAPFGAVRDILSYLFLKVRLIPALLLAPVPTGRPGRISDFVAVSKMNDEGGVKQCKVKLDTADLREKVPYAPIIEIMLLEIESGFTGAQWHVKGLIVRCGNISKAQLADAERKKSEAVTLDPEIKSTIGSSASEETLRDEIGKRPTEASQEKMTKSERDGYYSAAQIECLRYQFRRVLGDKVAQWSAEEVERYAREQAHEIRGKSTSVRDKIVNTPNTVAVVEPDEVVFRRVGTLNFTPATTRTSFSVAAVLSVTGLSTVCQEL